MNPFKGMCMAFFIVVFWCFCGEKRNLSLKLTGMRCPPRLSNSHLQ